MKFKLSARKLLHIFSSPHAKSTAFESLPIMVQAISRRPLNHSGPVSIPDQSLW